MIVKQFGIVALRRPNLHNTIECAVDGQRRRC